MGGWVVGWLGSWRGYHDASRIVHFPYFIFQAFPLAGMDAETLAGQVARIADKTEHWRNILNAFQVAEREKGAAAAEDVLLDAIHGGTGGIMRV